MTPKFNTHTTMSELDLRLSTATAQDTGSFRLLELPPELCQIIESASEKTASLFIKGHPTEDAVLCTLQKTYAVRSVVLSNSVLVVTPSRSDPDGTVHIRDQLHEILELVPVVPKLHKLSILLRDMEYDEGDEDKQATMPKYSYEQARSEIQASEAEFVLGLKERRILVLEGQLRPIAPAHLSTILELLLNYLISMSLSHQAAPIEELVSVLADEHEIPRVVSKQVMSWFGDVKEGLWKMDVDAVIRELGVGIFRHHRHNPISENEFLKKWKNVVGDTFESSVKLSLLSGDYLRNLSSIGEEASLTYFPSSALPVDPAARFVELFLTRQRWKHEEIEHFLLDIAVNSKERDKLLLKHARALTDTEGVWYTARVSYNN
ncbi:sister chromatid cohesion protein Dcc1 [Suillus plorans]|uniref:Sister chromatid cohesion protein Dcc1 n=1 Tax=Suillus plorans TaxID=116603 RepID=A0A9P7DTN7_9AGAM|nr:sister chromatid cohesion protein Dcc1 [Suillus plorans]KAG1802728.1 sister chromatid cohesion protein Dcc1 [Suillus plorans]